jgi:NDP-sugar pyrophosphorylase family protein
MLKPADFFDLAHLTEPYAGLFADIGYVWEIIPRLEAYLNALFPARAGIEGIVEAGAVLVDADRIYIGPGTRVEAGSYIKGPAYIGANCEVRHGAYLRGSVMAADEVILGHASEFKNALILSGAHAAHFAYVGDAILGHRVNLGAGTKLANVEMLSASIRRRTGIRPTIKIPVMGLPEPIDTGLPKLGAIFGDDAQCGCNTVTNPGTLVGPRTLVYANSSLRKGFWGSDKIVKMRQQIEVVDRFDN